MSGRGAADDTRRAPRAMAPAGPRYAARHAVAGRAAGGARPAGLRARLSRPGIGRAVAQTAGFNTVFTMAGALSGVIVARATGPVLRGEYTAVTSWMGIVLILSQLGQPVALCFYVARNPRQAHAYLATSRTMMLASGTLALAGGLALARVLGRGHPGLARAYVLAFISVPIACVAGSYLYALMGRAIPAWNRARVSQPLAALAAMSVLWLLRMLTLDTALAALIGSLLVQLGWSYRACRRVGLAPGRTAPALVRPLSAYGVAQIAAVAPASLNLYLDQLVLSVTVPPADLGCYSIAVAITLLPGPLVSAIGFVLLPALAVEQSVTPRIRTLQRTAVLCSLGLATAILLPLALAAPLLIPLVFGPAYRGAIPLLWILAPGGIFLASGQVVANLLRGLKRQMVVARAEGVALLFTLGLLAVLLPVMGVTGAAIASTVPYGISLALMLRHLRIPEVTDEGTS